MHAQNKGKLNRLLAELGDTRLVSSRWLRAHDYSNSLVAGYVSSGWLVSPARGVYMRAGGRLQWDGVFRSLQSGKGMALHVGGRFALALQGHEHYLRLGDAGTITLYGSGPPPGWVGKLSMEQRFEYLGKGPFDMPTVSFTAEVSETALSEAGLAWHSVAPGAPLRQHQGQATVPGAGRSSSACVVVACAVGRCRSGPGQARAGARRAPASDLPDHLAGRP